MGSQENGARALHISGRRLHINYQPTRLGVARFGFYVGVVALAVLIWQVQQGMFSRPYIEAQTESLNPLQEQQLSAFLEMNRLLVTLGTATLGALGFLMSANKGGLKWRELISAAISAILAGCSLYFGYLAYQGILWMLQSSFFNLDNPAILWARRAHFYTLLLSAFFFADFIIHDVGKEQNHEHTRQNPAP